MVCDRKIISKPNHLEQNQVFQDMRTCSVHFDLISEPGTTLAASAQDMWAALSPQSPANPATPGFISPAPRCTLVYTSLSIYPLPLYTPSFHTISIIRFHANRLHSGAPYIPWSIVIPYILCQIYHINIIILQILRHLVPYRLHPVPFLSYTLHIMPASV